MQGFLARTLYQLCRPLGFEVWVEQRIRTRLDPRRYRIPDVCLTFGEPHEDVFIDPPFLVYRNPLAGRFGLGFRIKIDEYLAMGVANVWVLDPIALNGEIYTVSGIEPARDGNLRAGDIEVNIGNPS